MRPDLGAANEVNPLLDQGLSRLVRRMRLACDDQLHRALRVGQDAQQARGVMQQQVRAFVGGEAAGKPQRQRVGAEEMSRLFNGLGRRARRRIMAGQAVARVVDQRLAGGCAELPEFGIGDATNFPFAVSSAMTSKSLGPASKSIATRPTSSRLAMLT